MRLLGLALLLAAGCRRYDDSGILLPKMSGEPREVLEKVDWGDRHFSRAMFHLRNSDPAQNPAGWRDENRKALERFKKANDEGYLPALELYPKVPPEPLLDQVRECTMRLALCRKRGRGT